MEIVHLEVLQMDNGELLCAGKTVGFVDGKNSLAKFVKPVPAERNQQERDMTDEEREEIARLIVEGNTSGILDADGYRCAWELSANIFKN